MRQKSSSHKEEITNMNLVINLVKLAAAAFFVFGLCLFLDAYGLATMMQITQGEINKMIGGVAMILAVIDVIIVPRILQQAMEKKRQERDRRR